MESILSPFSIRWENFWCERAIIVRILAPSVSVINIYILHSQRLLEFDQNKRISAKDALKHLYFTDDDDSSMFDSQNTSMSSESTSENIGDTEDEK